MNTISIILLFAVIIAFVMAARYHFRNGSHKKCCGDCSRCSGSHNSCGS